MATTTTPAANNGDGDGVELQGLRHRIKAGDGEADAQVAPKQEDGDAGETIEQVFAGYPLAPWRDQITLRALIVSFFLAVLFCVIVMKLNLTTGIIPSLNVAAGLLGFFFVRLITVALGRAGLLRRPFTRQENTVVQTCVVAAYGIAFSGGFGSYMFGMSSKIASQVSDENDSENIKDPELGWMIEFLLLVSFLGLFAIVILRKIMIIDYKLTYPSGTATAHLINSFHTPSGSKLAKKQVKSLGVFCLISFFWGFFQWFYTAGDNCGFESFPSLGLQAYNNRFYFDFSTTYVGVGMICPHIVNVSVLLGGILSWGIMWPLIAQKRGDWYAADLPDSSLHGMQGYRVFIAIALILGDGMYNFLKVSIRTAHGFYAASMASARTTLPVSDNDAVTDTGPVLSFDDERRTRVFLKDQIPLLVALGGYAAIAIISIACLPLIFSQLKWHHILVAYLVAPVLAFCNAYGTGLTDWSLASTYGKLAIFVFGAWAGASHGGVLAGLVACGVMMNIVSTASDLMQDFKTGYLTLASPRSMFVSQVIGTAIGCIVAPCVFWLFYKAFPDLGVSGSEYPAPYALIYRSISLLAVQGFGTLPKNCLTLCAVFFAGAMLINLVKDVLPTKVSRFIPIPMAMGIPFYLGSYFAIDMFIGSVILFVWTIVNKTQADTFGPAVASGLICGDGMWSLPQSFLALAKVNPPICMKFLSRSVNQKVDAYLQTIS